MTVVLQQISGRAGLGSLFGDETQSGAPSCLVWKHDATLPTYTGEGSESVVWIE